MLLISGVKGRTRKLLNNRMSSYAAEYIDSSDNRFLIRGSDRVESWVLVQGVPRRPRWRRKVHDGERQKG